MGTRNLTAVFSGGEYKIAQYGQWDGYPSGAGVNILDFLSKEGNIYKLVTALDNVRFLEPEGQDKEFIESYDKNAPEWSSDPDNRTEDQIYWFNTYASRNIGSDILRVVSSSNDEEILLNNRLSFAGDSLFCEYAYVIDLDKGVFEAYEGFNEEKVTEGRFVSGDESLDDSKYEPVKIVKSYNLNNLPTEEEFLSDLEPEDEE